MEDILAVILIFGGGTCALLAYSPVGRALADRIRARGGGTDAEPAGGAQLAETVDLLRREVAELAERVDFTERMLAQRDEGRHLPPPQGGVAH